MIHVQTRQQFDNFIEDMRRTKTRVFDTETMGLKTYRGDVMISLSVHLPEINVTYNLPFRYGRGVVEINYTSENHEGLSFTEMNWQGRTKKQMYLSYWYDKFAAHMESQEDENGDYLNYFENLPESWIEEVKAVWGRGVYIGHNTRFDAHVLNVEGFPDMETVYDTMIALHIVNEDWRGIEVEAPYRYTQKDEREGRVSAHMIGQWATDGEGKLLKRKQQGNRGLKWQAAMHEFPHATEGEQGLSAARIAFEDTLADFAFANWQNPINDSLITKKQLKALATWDGVSENDDVAAVKEKFRSKIELDDKANMWMLPSGQVAYYAMLDVELTFQLFNWCIKIIKDWHNEDLFEKQSAIHHRVAWEMERNGFKLDVAQAQREIDALTPRIAEIEAAVDRAAEEYIVKELETVFTTDGNQALASLVEARDDDHHLNIASPKQLLPLLNSGILGYDFGTRLFPDWWPTENTLELKLYPRVRLSEGDLEEQFDPLEGTAKAELQKVEDHPIARLVREHRRMKKSVTTYLQKWLDARDAYDIVRFAMNDDGTVAGRMSSSGDAGNGQNIPDRNGYTIKRAIISPWSNYKIVAFDYGQLELRLGAWIGETLLGFDPQMTMTKLFLSGEDMHSYVRDMIRIREILFKDMDDRGIVVKLGYKLDNPKSATPEQWAEIVAEYCRFVAKTMNFGLVYNGGAPMLMKLLRLDEATAKILVRKWRDMFPAFPRTQSYLTKLALTRRAMPNGDYPGSVMYVTQPISGRHRKLHRYPTHASYKSGDEWLSYNPMEAAARKVWNNTNQGLGGYICAYSALRIGDELGRDKIRMFANIHDALEMFLHEDHLYLVKDIMSIMTDWPTIVPELTVDPQCSTDGTWQGMTKIKDVDLWIATAGKEGYKK